MRRALDGVTVMLEASDRQAIQSIADETFQRRIEAERQFIANTFKTALWIAGLALSAVIAIFGFAGWQRFNEVQTEAREHAQKAVQRYIDDQVALKDARAELDRQYGEALVRTLRNGRGRSDLDEEFAVTRSQIDRLLQVLLLDFERRIRLESPMEKSVLFGYMQRRGPDELVASARALALFAYPSEKE